MLQTTTTKKVKKVTSHVVTGNQSNGLMPRTEHCSFTSVHCEAVFKKNRMLKVSKVKLQAATQVNF